MGVNARQLDQADIIRLESELNNLWGELNTCNIPYAKRTEMENQLTQCEEQLRSVLSGRAPFKELETNLDKCNEALALAVVQQAENEIAKTEKTSSSFLALENVRKELQEGRIKPVKARHEVKAIMRHHP